MARETPRVRASLDDPDADVQARGRALSSPLRLRILRLCAFESRTNKELAELLDVNPGTMLHHVRTLTQTGFLAAEPDRAGAKGAREVPYRATGLSWRTEMPNMGQTLLATFLQQIEHLAPDELEATWMGLKLDDAHHEELLSRIFDILEEFRLRGPDADGDTYSLFLTLHPDRNPPSGHADAAPTG